jgi:AcrR family transcriptional regulator
MATDPPVPVIAPRGRPRSDRARQAILLATTAILEERGFAALTIEEVATRAGVGKATVYRWWSTKGTLAFDAFGARFLEHHPLPDTGSLEGDLLAALRSWIDVVDGTTTGRILTGLLAEVQHDPELADEWRRRFVNVVRAQQVIMIERAIERSEISAECDSDVVLDLLYGPAYHRLLHSHLPLTDEFAWHIVDIIVLGLNAQEVSGRR